MVGFTKKGWLPVEEYKVTREWPIDTVLSLDMVNPEDFLDDQERMLEEGNYMDDDIIRGACPHQGIPWNCAIIGGKLRILPGSLLAEDMNLEYSAIPEIELNSNNPWFMKYMAFIDALVLRAQGRYPVSHGCVVGPTDLAVILRGHTNTAMDMMDDVPEVQKLFTEMGKVFVSSRDAAWDMIPLWQQGYYDAQGIIYGHLDQ